MFAIYYISDSDMGYYISILHQDHCLINAHIVYNKDGQTKEWITFFDESGQFTLPEEIVIHHSGIATILVSYLEYEHNIIIKAVHSLDTGESFNPPEEDERQEYLSDSITVSYNETPQERVIFDQDKKCIKILMNTHGMPIACEVGEIIPQNIIEAQIIVDELIYGDSTRFIHLEPSGTASKKTMKAIISYLLDQNIAVSEIGKYSIKHLCSTKQYFTTNQPTALDTSFETTDTLRQDSALSFNSDYTISGCASSPDLFN